jgi:hypothetical protein
MEQALISSGNEVRFKNFHLILNSQLQKKKKKKKNRYFKIQIFGFLNV